MWGAREQLAFAVMMVDYQPYPVVYVDDEPENLVTFRYAMGDQFSVMTASSGREAVDLLERQADAVGDRRDAEPFIGEG